MRELRIALFGHVHIGHEGIKQEPKVTRTLQGLLAFLVLHSKQRCARETLIGLFWGEQPQVHARNCLNTALWRLRRLLEPKGVPAGTFLLTNASGEVGFNWDSPHWLDVEIFETRALRTLTESPEGMTLAQARALREGLALYTGDLLEGFYDDWALHERERMRLLYLKGWAQLMRFHKMQQDYEAGIFAAQQILLQDPLREEIHRELMRLYLSNGQRADAVRQYEICRAALETELAIPPMEETQQLYQNLFADTLHERAIPAPPAPEWNGAVHDLKDAMRALDDAREQLQQAIHRFETVALHPERARRNM